MSHTCINYDKIINAPITCKIMGLIIMKNFSYGLYKGIKNFSTSNKPVTQLYDNIASYTIWGLAEAFFWPITFPYIITCELDIFVNFLMNKNQTRVIN